MVKWNRSALGAEPVASSTTGLSVGEIPYPTDWQAPLSARFPRSRLQYQWERHFAYVCIFSSTSSIFLQIGACAVFDCNNIHGSYGLMSWTIIKIINIIWEADQDVIISTATTYRQLLSVTPCWLAARTALVRNWREPDPTENISTSQCRGDGDKTSHDRICRYIIEFIVIPLHDDNDILHLYMMMMMTFNIYTWW